jgi:hypothetical protein
MFFFYIVALHLFATWTHFSNGRDEINFARIQPLMSMQWASLEQFVGDNKNIFQS